MRNNNNNVTSSHKNLPWFTQTQATSNLHKQLFKLSLTNTLSYNEYSHLSKLQQVFTHIQVTPS